MFHLNDQPLFHRVLPRNEGKLKTYDSCCDFRAWNHDADTRSQYLKQWMKADMPICVIPVCILTSVLEKMTITSRSTVPPRCHPDCKSKILLDNIYESCNAMKKCLSQERSFDRFFEEEELETSNWPCDQCLDTLKTIKMFWKVVAEKVFRINFTRCPCSTEYVRHKDSVKSIAMSWCREIVQQSFYIRCRGQQMPTQNNLDSYSCDRFFVRKSTDKHKRCKSEFNCHHESITLLREGKTSNTPKPITESRGNQTRSSFISHNRGEVKKVSRYTCTKAKTTEAGCDTCNSLESCQVNIDKLQHLLYSERMTNEKLRREVKTLRCELENVYENCTWKMYCDPNKKFSYKVNLVPKCSDSCLNVNDSPTYKLDSETVITMKKLQNKNFDHVSLLQVLHKTNKPTIDELMLSQTCEKQYEPHNLLNGVKNTFESLMKREWSKAASQMRVPNIAERSTVKKTHSSSSLSRTTYSSDSAFDYLSARGAQHFMEAN